MLDDFLREEGDDTSSFLDELEESSKIELSPEPETGFLGMTPFQRFIISFMFFLMVLIIGAFFLLITGVIAIPIS
ncbi:MAG TPA: hypothetical protein VI703_00215 [Anaerolineales bacterium]|nr:hypothetical protein [Anaerolineales bacterium]